MKPASAITVLSISPMGEDHRALADILRRYSGELTLATTWTLEQGIALMRIQKIPIAICERDLQPGHWEEVLRRAVSMPHAPLVIVTSRLADERLWAEALNLGAWDVLAKPFDGTEVTRAIESAWLHYQTKHMAVPGVQETWRAAS